MIHFAKHRVYIVFLSLLSFVYVKQTQGQERINIYGGYGVTEMLTIGTRLQINQVQLGIGLGGPGVNTGLTHSGDVFYHFGGHSELSIRRPWYLKGGLTKHTNLHSLIINLRLGRDINLSKKVGLNIEAGLLIGKEFLNESVPYGHFESGLMLGFGIFFYYRL